MKRIIPLLLVILLLLCSCSETELETPPNMKLASVEATDYYMYVPNDWVIANQTGITSAYVSVTDNSNVSCAKYTVSGDGIFSAETSADGKTEEPEYSYARNYFVGYEAELKSTLPGYTLVNAATCLLDGAPSMRYIFNATLSGTQYQYCMVICIRDNAYAYILTYTATAENYSTNYTSFESIADEFVFQTGLLK